MGKTDYLQIARRTIDIESKAIESLSVRLDSQFERACEAMLNCQGRIIVTGMGKSGHIASKIAATLASTGTPAFALHPAEASHGDLGMITPSDIVIAISGSGSTQEIVSLLPLIRRIDCQLIALTGNAASLLAEQSDIHIDVHVDSEACPLGLAPTSSTTAALVMGDALAIALLEARGFSAEDFAFSHPGGALGKRLLLKVEDVMQSGEQLPLVTESTPLAEALVEISNKGLGMTTVVNGNGELEGVFTDGDLRRALDNKLDIHNSQIGALMTRNSKTIAEGVLAAQALKIMEDNHITTLVVVQSNGKPSGVVHLHALIQAGLA